MDNLSGTTSTSSKLEYSTLRRRWPWKPYLLGVMTLPLAYLVLYVILRATGVFYPYYSQGTWEIDGGTGIDLVDLPFIPLAVTEGNLQNRLRWLEEPTGG